MEISDQLSTLPLLVEQVRIILIFMMKDRQAQDSSQGAMNLR